MEQFSENITIAIPVFDRYEFFESALNSALNQTVGCAVIVVDNNSPHTRFQDYVVSLGNSNVTYFKNDINLGMIGNWNRCLELVTTKWITILHDDDLLYPNFVECFEICRKVYPDICCIASGWTWDTQPAANVNDVQIINELKVRTFETKEFNYNIYSPFPGVALNKQKHTLKFLESAYPIADFDFWVRLSKEGTLIKHSVVQTYYRLNKSQTMSKVMDGIVKDSYTYRRTQIGFRNFYERLMCLATTVMSSHAGKDWYQVDIDLVNFVEPRDKTIIKLLKIKLLLYGVYVLKYATYRFGLLFKYKKIL